MTSLDAPVDTHDSRLAKRVPALTQRESRGVRREVPITVLDTRTERGKRYPPIWLIERDGRTKST